MLHFVHDFQFRNALFIGILLLVSTGCVPVQPVVQMSTAVPTPTVTPTPTIAPTPVVNEPVVSVPQPVNPGEQIGISIRVDSVAGVELSYEWSVLEGQGEILAGQGTNAITYEPPVEPGTYGIRVKVTTTNAVIERSTFVTVLSPDIPAPLSMITPSATLTHSVNVNETIQPTVVVTPASLSTFCPDTIARDTISTWDIGATEIDNVQPYLDAFESHRKRGGGFVKGDTIPVGVIITTDFGNGQSEAWEIYPVKPIIHFRSWGLFEVTRSFSAPSEGSCITISPPTDTLTTVPLADEVTICGDAAFAEGLATSDPLFSSPNGYVSGWITSDPATVTLPDGDTRVFEFQYVLIVEDLPFVQVTGVVRHAGKANTGGCWYPSSLSQYIFEDAKQDFCVKKTGGNVAVFYRVSASGFEELGTTATISCP